MQMMMTMDRRSENRVMLLLLMCGGILAVTSATRIDSVCTSVPTAKGIARPDISNIFQVDVECTMQEQNRTIFVKEYFDYDNNRGRITQTDLLAKGDAFFDYSDNEIIFVDINNNKCLVGQLSTSDNRWMFGYKSMSQGMPHVFGASGALHFGDSPEEYIGQTVVRGITVDQWDSCQYSDVLNATMKVTWYFSAKTAWDMQVGARAVPIRATAEGKQYKFGKIVPFNHTYDLYNFRTAVSNQDFEIPVGVVCPGRIKTKAFPQIPTRFSFIGEVLDYNRGVVTYLEENYDLQMKINVFRYKQAQDTSSLTNVNRMLQVNDFNTGVSYVIDTAADSCQIAQLGYVGYAFVNYVSSGKVVMKSPAQFLADMSRQMYTYAGVRTVRDMPCELWVGTTDKIQGFTDRNVTAEWYFALTSDVESWNSMDDSWRMPVQFRMWNQGENDPIWEFNVFYFDVVRPNLISADISPCFHGSKRRRFTFDIEGGARAAVYNNIEMFKYALSSAISLTVGISPLRVADIEAYYDSTVIHVSFDLLDKASVVGDVANITVENDLDSAVQLYNDAVASGNLQLSIVVGGNVQQVTPIPDSASEVGSSNPFTAGALAGLGVAMLVVGSAGGAGVAFFFFK